MQHTLAGASVYALSKNDTARRLSNFQSRSGKALTAGPALLIQREFPSKKDFKALNEIVHDFSNGNTYLWDNRIFLQVRSNIPENTSDIAKNPLIFKIMPLCPKLVKEFETATKLDFSARKKSLLVLGNDARIAFTHHSCFATHPFRLHGHSDFELLFGPKCI